MPHDTEGNKWACESCIRGHRSSGCKHFKRFMVRVRKPGRPLAKCPHPKGKCDCGQERVLMVKIPIPKGFKCEEMNAPDFCMCEPAGNQNLNDGMSKPFHSSHGSRISQYDLPTPGPEPLDMTVPLSLAAGHHPIGIQEGIARHLDGFGHPNPISPLTAPPNIFSDSSRHRMLFNIAGRSELIRHDGMNWEPSWPNPEHGYYQTNEAPTVGQRVNSAMMDNVNEDGSSGVPTRNGSFCSMSDSSDMMSAFPRMSQPSGLASRGSRNVSELGEVETDQFMRFDNGNNMIRRLQPCVAEHVSLPSSMFPMTPQESDGCAWPSDAYANPRNYAYRPPMYSQHMETVLDNRPNLGCHHSYASNCHCGPGCQCIGCPQHPANSTMKNHIRELSHFMSSNGERDVGREQVMNGLSFSGSETTSPTGINTYGFDYPSFAPNTRKIMPLGDNNVSVTPTNPKFSPDYLYMEYSIPPTHNNTRHDESETRRGDHFSPINCGQQDSREEAFPVFSEIDPTNQTQPFVQPLQRHEYVNTGTSPFSSVSSKSSL